MKISDFFKVAKFKNGWNFYFLIYENNKTRYSDYIGEEGDETVNGIKCIPEDCLNKEIKKIEFLYNPEDDDTTLEIFI